MQTKQAESPAPPSVKWGAMVGIGMGVLMATLDGGIVNISLPTLVEDLNTTLATVQWVMLSYLMVITSLMLGVARLGDMFGKKRFYQAGLALFTLGSLLCGLSPTVEVLIAMRAVQGLGAVMTTALGTAIITEVFPPSERGRALGIMGSIVSVGIALGPTAGGVMIGLAGWHAVFLVNVPVGIIAYFVVKRLVPPSSRGAPGQRFDWTGAAILFVALLAYTVGMTLGQTEGFGGGTPLALLLTALVGLAVFLAVEARVSHPMVDLRLFRNPLFSINLLMALLVFIVLAGNFIFPFFLEYVKGYPVTQQGLMIAVIPVCMGLVAPISGSLSDRFGSRIISLIGLLVIVVGCLCIGTLHEDVTVAEFMARIAPFGVGMGMFQSPNNSAIMGTAPRERLGVASGLLALSRTLGQISGLPLMGALFTVQVIALAGLPTGVDVTGAPAAALVGGVAGAYRISAVVILVATILAALAWGIDHRQHKARASATVEPAQASFAPSPESERS